MRKFILGFAMGAVLFGTAGAIAASSEMIPISRNVESLIINGNTYEMEDRMFTHAGTTYVPLRFVAETFNHLVEWDGGNKAVRIHLDPCMMANGIALHPLPTKSGSFHVSEQRALCINDRALLLPKDVTLEGLVYTDHHTPASQLPAYILKRGDSIVTVGFKGMLLGYDSDTLHDFDFLKDFVQQGGADF